MKSNNQIKDKYRYYTEKKEFSEYWDDYQYRENLSMKESIHQKKERIEKLHPKS